jgi:ABC-2 type transport system permease protein
MKTLQWLLRREFWEHRGGLFWAPAAIGGIMALLAALSLIAGGLLSGKSSLTVNDRAVQLADIFADGRIAQAGAFVFAAAAVPLLATLAFVVFFFCVGALYDDRKDRSILFWKSLPVNDALTVLSKLLTALAVAPLLTLAIATVTGWVLLAMLALAAVLVGVGGIGALFTNGDLFLAPLQGFAILPIYALWALPTAAWLLTGC